MVNSSSEDFDQWTFAIDRRRHVPPGKTDWIRMRPYRGPLRGQGIFFAVRSSADCITNMSGFDLRQAHLRKSGGHMSESESRRAYSPGSVSRGNGAVTLSMIAASILRFDKSDPSCSAAAQWQIWISAQRSNRPNAMYLCRSYGRIRP
jgi:hypothetical protein